MPHTKNVYIFNAIASDEIKVDGRIVKRRNADVPRTQKEQHGLRVSFMDNLQTARQIGFFDCLDALVLDANEVRNKNNSALEYSIYGRGRNVKVEVS